MRRPWEASPLTHLMLGGAGLLSIFPIYWMIVIATRSNDAINNVPPSLLPGANLFENLARLFANDHAAFLFGLTNSVVVAGCLAISVVFFSSLAGFAFAKLRFRGSNALLLVIVGTMLVPTQLGIIPLYILMGDLGWRDDLKAVIVPFMVTGLGVFMMRQYTVSAVSDELVEAARMDGCSTLRIYWNVVLPALRPAAAVLGLLTFMAAWNDFLWPFTVLDPDTPTVQVSLALLSTAYYTDYSQVFAGTALATVPLLAVFVIFGRQIIGGIMEGAVKG